MTKATLEKKEIKDEGQAWKKEEVYFEFYNLEEPGLMQKFVFGTTKNIQKYMLFHGEKYKLPREVADHVESKQTPIWGYKPDGNGRMVKSLNGWKSRFQMREVRDR